MTLDADWHDALIPLRARAYETLPPNPFNRQRFTANRFDKITYRQPLRRQLAPEPPPFSHHFVPMARAGSDEIDEAKAPSAAAFAAIPAAAPKKCRRARLRGECGLLSDDMDPSALRMPGIG
jgi:hypothetical protein